MRERIASGVLVVLHAHLGKYLSIVSVCLHVTVGDERELTRSGPPFGEGGMSLVRGFGDDRRLRFDVAHLLGADSEAYVVFASCDAESGVADGFHARHAEVRDTRYGPGAEPQRLGDGTA